MTHIHTLQNGMRVIFAPVEGAESVTVMVVSGTGSRYESAKENGMAHFLEHMVFKGTKKRPTAKVIAETLDGVGGEFNAFTSKDHTAYYAKVDKQHFKDALSVISDVFLNPLLPKGEIERERGTVVEEINMYLDMPIRQVGVVFDEILFGKNNSLGRSILGPKKNILRFTREEFLQYFNRNYVAENSAICVSGSFSQTAALKEIRKIFKNMRVGEIPQHEPYMHAQEEARVKVEYKATDQTHFVLGVPAYSHVHKDRYVLEVIAAILGGGMSSRLFTEIRERRGLAYYVKADTDQYSDIGSFYVRAGVSNPKLNDSVKMCLKELRGLKRTKVSAAELKKAREYVKGTSALSLDTTDALAQFVGYEELVRESRGGFKAFKKGIDAVTTADVMRVAKEIFKTKQLNLAVIGPHKNEKVLQNLLKV